MIVQVIYSPVGRDELVIERSPHQSLPDKGDKIIFEGRAYTVIQKTFEHKFVQHRKWWQNAEHTVLETTVTIHLVY